MKLGTALLVIGCLALAGLAIYFATRKPVPVAGGDNRSWWERGADAITPDRLKVGYAGFGIDLAF